MTDLRCGAAHQPHVAGNRAGFGAFNCEPKPEDIAMKLATLLPLLAILLLSACETVQGAGRDLESAGEAITEESQETQSGY